MDITTVVLASFQLNELIPGAPTTSAAIFPSKLSPVDVVRDHGSDNIQKRHSGDSLSKCTYGHAWLE
jgi:hypothetical protein